MKKEMTLFVLGILLLGSFFIIAQSSKVSAVGEVSYCAEKTTNGAKCMNVPLNEVNTNYRYDRTSCESTTYCSKGTCLNTATGECLSSSRSVCDPEKGGYFYDKSKDEVDSCKTVCCILGDGANFVERNRCNALGKDLGINPEIVPNVADEVSCLALGSSKTKVACVFEKEEGRDCDFITRGECNEAGGEPHEGFLCSAQELGTVCKMTKRTTCTPRKNEVYFVDSCGNLANVYDAEKITDVAYWSYIPGKEGVEVNLGDGEGNIGSTTYGACDYFSGSTCGSGNARYGNYICTDLRCSASDPLSGGEVRQNGEEWCSEPISNFEDAKPGDLSYHLYCFNGEIQYDLCDYSRDLLCMEDEETGRAGCVVNRWMECATMTNTKDCLDENIRDCKILKDASSALLRTQYGTEKKIWDSDAEENITATCVPKYTPGFKSWDPTGTIADVGGESTDKTPMSMCKLASVVCYVRYTKEIELGIVGTNWRVTPSDACVQMCEDAEDWSDNKCFKECTPVCLDDFDGEDADVARSWALGYQNLCTSLGDCGVSANYLGGEGYNDWKDLFTGKGIDWTTLPNGDSKK